MTKRQSSTTVYFGNNSFDTDAWRASPLGTRGKSIKIYRILGSTIRFLLPAPLDAWLLATMIYWIVAAVGSILWYVQAPNADPFDLHAPLVAGAFAMILAVFLGRFSASASWQAPALFLVTILGGILLDLRVGDWLDIYPTAGAGTNHFREIDTPTQSISRSGYVRVFAANPLVVLASIMTVLIVSSGIPAIRPIFSAAARWAATLLTWIDNHRQNLMIAFAAITVPATMIRNALDFEHQSSPYLWIPLSIVLSIAAALTTIYLLGRFVLNHKWLKLKVICCVLVITAASVVLFTETFAYRQNRYYNPSTIGNDIAIVLVPALFGLSMLAVALCATSAASRQKSRQFSVWSLVIVLSTGGFIGYTLNTFDLNVPANVFLQYDRRFVRLGWIQDAQDSRVIQRASGGAARMIQEGGVSAIHVRVRDERDANCLQDVFGLWNMNTSFIAIENLQPFVDTAPLAGHQADVAIIGGELTPEQMQDIGKPDRILAVKNLRLPDVSNGASIWGLRTFGQESIPGLPEFLDAYASRRTKKVEIIAPLSMEDLDSIIRISGFCQVSIDSIDLLPDDGQSLAKLSDDRPLPLHKIIIKTIDLLKNQTTCQVLNSGIQVISLSTRDEQQFWDIVFSGPNVSRIWLHNNESQFEFVQKAEQFHWAYQWNEQGEITHLWIPNIDDITDQETALSKLETLRLDRRGFLSGYSGWRIDLLRMPSLPNLQRLYLPSGSVLDDLSHLERFTNLKHLQLQEQSRAGMLRGYSGFKNLESVQFFGTPAAQTIKELATLKKLRSVTIIDDDGSFVLPAVIKSLKSQLPGINVTIVPPSEYEPERSDALKRHQATIRQELFESNPDR